MRRKDERETLQVIEPEKAKGTAQSRVERRTRVRMKHGVSHHRDQTCPWRTPFIPNQSF